MPQLKVIFDLRNSKEVRDAIENVKYGVVNRVVKSAIAKESRAVAKRAKERTPRGATGALRKSIGTIYKSYRSRLVWVYVVGPRKGFRTLNSQVENAPLIWGNAYRYRNPTKYAHLAERGRKSVSAKLGKMLRFFPTPRAKLPIFKQSVRESRAFLFMEFAWTVTRTSGEHFIIKDILSGIQREAAKYAAKGKSIYNS